MLTWPDKQQKTSSNHTLSAIQTRNAIPMMIPSHCTKEGPIRYYQQTHFFLPQFLFIFLFFPHVSSSLSISVTHLLHVVTILRNRKRGLLCQRDQTTTQFPTHPNHRKTADYIIDYIIINLLTISCSIYVLCYCLCKQNPNMLTLPINLHT